ncbi:hypothetical protein O9993_21970 [Vibrio lentus]|nr:hypothetical protein [Vibrio lentus]
MIVELTGTTESIQLVKSPIVFPGLFVLGSSDCSTWRNRCRKWLSTEKEKIVERKSKWMPIIAFNGIFILIPAAYFLNQWASSWRDGCSILWRSSVRTYRGCH